MKSYPKHEKSDCNRDSRPCKRPFHGKQHSAKPTDEEEANTSSSAKKLSTASTDNIIVTPTHCYRIIEFVTVFFALAEMLICRPCKQRINFEESGHRGLGFKIVVSCVCG